MPVRAGKCAEHVRRVEGPLSRPHLPGGNRGEFLGRLNLDRGAPVDVARIDEISLRIVSRAVPLLTASGSRTEMRLRLGREGRVDILDGRDRRLVELLVVGQIEAVEET